MAPKEIDLTGSKLHRFLRNQVAELTPNYDKRQERRDRFDADFGNCARCRSGQPADKCRCS